MPLERDEIVYAKRTTVAVSGAQIVDGAQD